MDFTKFSNEELLEKEKELEKELQHKLHVMLHFDDLDKYYEDLESISEEKKRRGL